MSTQPLPKVIEEHIKKMYPNWLQQSERMCRIRGLYDEAEDVLHEVICYILEHYSITEIKTMYRKKEKGYTSLDGLVYKILRNNIMSTTAPYYRKYRKHWQFQDQNTDVNELNVPDEEKTDLWLFVVDVFYQLHLPEKEQAIFCHYYIEHKKLCDWEGPESISKLSRICKNIIKELKEKINKNPPENAKKRNKLYFIYEAAEIK